MHWAAKYIGIPYREGARGPTFFDCWGIIQAIYQTEHGIVLPEMPGLSAANPEEINTAIRDQMTHTEMWQERTSPIEGNIVALGTSETFYHVGVWIACDGGKVLHCRNGQNTVAEALRRLRLRGFKNIKFYQHAQWPG